MARYKEIVDITKTIIDLYEENKLDVEEILSICFCIYWNFRFSRLINKSIIEMIEERNLSIDDVIDKFDSMENEYFIWKRRFKTARESNTSN